MNPSFETTLEKQATASELRLDIATSSTSLGSQSGAVLLSTMVAVTMGILLLGIFVTTGNQGMKFAKAIEMASDRNELQSIFIRTMDCRRIAKEIASQGCNGPVHIYLRRDPDGKPSFDKDKIDKQTGPWRVSGSCEIETQTITGDGAQYTKKMPRLQIYAIRDTTGGNSSSQPSQRDFLTGETYTLDGGTGNTSHNLSNEQKANRRKAMQLFPDFQFSPCQNEFSQNLNPGSLIGTATYLARPGGSSNFTLTQQHTPRGAKSTFNIFSMIGSKGVDRHSFLELEITQGTVKIFPRGSELSIIAETLGVSKKAFATASGTYMVTLDKLTPNKPLTLTFKGYGKLAGQSRFSDIRIEVEDYH